MCSSTTNDGRHLDYRYREGLELDGIHHFVWLSVYAFAPAQSCKQNANLAHGSAHANCSWQIANGDFYSMVYSVFMIAVRCWLLIAYQQLSWLWTVMILNESTACSQQRWRRRPSS